MKFALKSFPQICRERRYQCKILSPKIQTLSSSMPTKWLITEITRLQSKLSAMLLHCHPGYQKYHVKDKLRHSALSSSLWAKSTVQFLSSAEVPDPRNKKLGQFTLHSQISDKQPHVSRKKTKRSQNSLISWTDAFEYCWRNTMDVPECLSNTHVERPVDGLCHWQHIVVHKWYMIAK